MSDEPRSVGAALEKLADFFATQQTRQGVLARRLLGRPAPGDADLTLRLQRQLAAQVGPDGSVPGGLAFTAFRLIELLELGCDEETPAVPRLTEWLLAQQEKPGAYGEGCIPTRHEQGACEHFLGGFLSPGPVMIRVAPVTFPNGKVFRVEPAARFALSCLGLRALAMTPARNNAGVRKHLISLARLKGAWVTWDGFFPPDLILTALAALGTAGDLERAATATATAFVVAQQVSDGGWPGADRFVAIEALLTVGSPEAMAAVRRSLAGLVSRQRDDGTFGPVAQQERALIALRGLLMGGGA